jgi:hypothetical protein
VCASLCVRESEAVYVCVCACVCVRVSERERDGVRGRPGVAGEQAFLELSEHGLVQLLVLPMEARYETPHSLKLTEVPPFL